MKIAITSITYEGLMRTNREFLDALNNAGHLIYIVSPSKTNVDEAIQKGYVYIPIYIEPHGTNPISEFKLYRQYLSIYKLINPDMVISMTIKPDVYSGLACRRLGVPYITVVNGIGDAIYNRGILSRTVLTLLKVSLKQCTWTFFQNKKNRQLFIKNKIVREDNSSVVPGSGININEHPYEAYPKCNNKIVITYIGRISKDKGIDELLLAAEKLSRKHKTIEFIVIGSCNKTYKEKIRLSDRNGYIKYIGRIPEQDIHGFIARSHAVILPSYHEGIPNVLLEAGAAGRPIISTFAEGCEDTFEDGISGIGFTIKSVSSVENAVEKFLSMTPEERERMGREAHKKIIKEFNRDLVIREYMKIISVMGGKNC